ncbi:MULTISPECIES: hypothetical protein [Mameliella]|uniref:hypothetical protein n=1 Tax=Mameliella TaxID=1434019 RepID=UPI000B52F258|nr:MULTISPECIES: hypothetical protein [Mameliella]MCR9274506.1 hypothetical protein [Paracoccaceae bacterium]OWV63013.1 hypothetical protein CDZ98_02265 [Mameliella alba]
MNGSIAGALVSNIIGGVIGQLIYAALVMLVLRWLFKKRVPYGGLFKVYILVFLGFFVLSFALGFALGAAGAMGILSVLITGLSIAVFVLQAYWVAQHVEPLDGTDLTMGNVLISQIVILVVAIAIGLVVVLALGGF